MDTLIYLASKSPRRREILSNLGWEPVVLADPKAPRGWFAGDEEEKPGETPDLWTTHPLSSGLPLFLIPELRAVSGNLRQPEVKCFAYK